MDERNRRKENREPHFLVKTFSFVVILVLIDFSIGNLLKYLYYKQDSGWLYRTTYALESTNADLLIFGASRANHHYYTALFGKRMNISCYNTGRDGNAIFYHYAILQGILKRYSPKMAILDFSHGEFMKRQDSYERISSLLPYYKKHPEIRSIVQLKSPYEKYKLMSSIYPYNSLLFQIAVGNAGFNRSRQNRNDDNGYVPLYKTWKGSAIVDVSPEKYELDTVKIRYYKSFIEDCIRSHVKLYIVLSPCFIKYRKGDASVLMGQQIAGEYHIPFYDFTNDPFFLGSPAIYADESHLNDSGAKIYTGKVIDRMLKDMPGTAVYAQKNTSLKGAVIHKNSIK